MNIVLMGMKHCGKSTHGKALADYLGCDFLDTDGLLELLYREQTGEKLSCREIFREIGGDSFRQLEEQVIDRLLELKTSRRGFRVISLGGGLPANDRLRPKLAALGCLVFIKVPPEVLFKRVMKRGIPPFLNPAEPHDSFMELYNAREKHYIACANLTIELADCPVAEARQTIIEQIEEFVNGQHSR